MYYSSQYDKWHGTGADPGLGVLRLLKYCARVSV